MRSNIHMIDILFITSTRLVNYHFTTYYYFEFETMTPNKIKLVLLAI